MRNLCNNVLKTNKLCKNYKSKKSCKFCYIHKEKNTTIIENILKYVFITTLFTIGILSIIGFLLTDMDIKEKINLLTYQNLSADKLMFVIF